MAMTIPVVVVTMNIHDEAVSLHLLHLPVGWYDESQILRPACSQVYIPSTTKKKMD